MDIVSQIAQLNHFDQKTRPFIPIICAAIQRINLEVD